jgi:hypothetical protein
MILPYPGEQAAGVNTRNPAGSAVETQVVKFADSSTVQAKPGVATICMHLASEGDGNTCKQS